MRRYFDSLFFDTLKRRAKKRSHQEMTAFSKTTILEGGNSKIATSILA